MISPRGVTFNGLDVNGYRLPTEAEWDRALRGDSVDLAGAERESELDELPWSAENSGRTLHPVALRRPNAWGLYDMLGNVSEWVFDWYVEGDWECPDADPIGPSEHQDVMPFSTPQVSPARAVKLEAKGKTTRGGSYLDASEYLKTGGHARGLDPKTRSPTVGFRVARTAAQLAANLRRTLG